MRRHARASPAPIEWAVSEQVLGIPARVEPAVLDAVRRAHPVVPARQESFRDAAETTMAVALPDASMMLSLVVGADGAVLVYAGGEDVFRAPGRLHGVAAALGADSIVHALAYTTPAGDVELGVFDAARLAGCDLSALPMLERHVQVHARLHAGPLPAVVRYHWAGFAGTCYHDLARAGKPFDAHQMLVFRPGGVVRVLGPLVTGGSR